LTVPILLSIRILHDLNGLVSARQRLVNFLGEGK
jgi:hypothetical protein